MKDSYSSACLMPYSLTATHYYSYRLKNDAQSDCNMPVWCKRFRSKSTTQQLPRVALKFFMLELWIDFKNGQDISYSAVHITIKHSFSSLVLSLLETLDPDESLDSENHVKADSIWLSSVPRFGLPEEALTIHTIQNFHASNLWSISAKRYRLARILWPLCVSTDFSVIGFLSLHILTHSFYQYWQQNGKPTSFRCCFLSRTKMRPTQE